MGVKGPKLQVLSKYYLRKKEIYPIVDPYKKKELPAEFFKSLKFVSIKKQELLKRFEDKLNECPFFTSNTMNNIVVQSKVIEINDKNTFFDMDWKFIAMTETKY